MSKPRVALIWAMADNNVIGKDNAMPWHLPEDLRYFRRKTLGKPVIMGRKTLDAIGKPLPRRTNIILSRSSLANLPKRVIGVTDFAQAIETATECCERDGVEELIVAGGANVYEQALPIADRLYCTHVHAQIDGDVRFPDVDLNAYVLRQSEWRAADNRHPHAFTWSVFDRIK